MPSQKKSPETVQTKKEDQSESNSTSASIYLCSDKKCLGLIGSEGICLECGKPKVESKEQKAVKQGQRIVCVDATCSGIIGEDGCCNECGMPNSPESEGKAESGVDEQKIISSSTSHSERFISGKFLAAILIIGGVLLWLWAYYDDEQKQVSTSSSGFDSPDKSKSPQQKKTPSATLSFSVEKPPAGTDNILGIAQIRYCLAEEMILKAMDIYLDVHAEPEVKAYNFYIDDYYKRCRSFRFSSGDLAIAKKDVEKENVQLRVEGKQRLFSVRASSKNSQVSSEPTQVSPSLIKDIQKELKSLGYEPETCRWINGIENLVSAIKKFQRITGQKVDGKPSAQLLERLEWCLLSILHEFSPTVQTRIEM